MRNGDRSANDQRNIESIEKLFSRHTNFRALFDVIGDAIVTAQNDRTRQAHQFLRPFVERAIFVSLRVERKKPFDAEMATAEQLLVHLSSIAIKIVHSQFLSIYVSTAALDFCSMYHKHSP